MISLQCLKDSPLCFPYRASKFNVDEFLRNKLRLSASDFSRGIANISLSILI